MQQKHCENLQEINQETTKWLKECKKITSKSGIASYIHTEPTGTIKIDHHEYTYISRTNDRFTLEMAKWHILLNQYDEAGSTLKESIFTDQNLMFIKAILLQKINEFDESVNEYKRILEKIPKGKSKQYRLIMSGYAIALHCKYKKNEEAQDSLKISSLTLKSGNTNKEDSKLPATSSKTRPSENNENRETLRAAYDAIYDVVYYTHAVAVSNSKQSINNHETLKPAITHQTLKALKKHSGTIFYICKSMEQERFYFDKLGSLLPSIFSAHNWNMLLVALEHYHKSTQLPLSSQPLNEYCKTVTRYGNNLQTGLPVRRR